MPVINDSEIPPPGTPVESATSCFSCSFEKVDGVYRVAGTDKLTDAQAAALQTAGDGLLRLVCNPTDGVRVVLPPALCSKVNGRINISRTDDALEIVDEFQFAYRMNSNQVNTGGVGSFYGSSAVNSTLTLPSIAFTNDGTSQSVLVRGYYETRNRIYSGSPATMNTQVEMSIDGGTTWIACSGNHANFNVDSAAQGSDHQQAIMNRFGSVAPGSYTAQFRVKLLANSFTAPTDEILSTQARLSVSWVGPVCG